MNKRIILIALILATAILLSSALVIHPARAVGSTIYFSPDQIPVPSVFPGTFVVNLTADALGASPTSGLNGWDIVVNDGDPAGASITPVSINAFSTGANCQNLLCPFGAESESINCVNNGAGIPVGNPGAIGCSISDGAGIAHTSVTLLGPATPFPVSGLIAQITYTVTAPPPAPISITVEFATLSDGSPTPVPATTRTATFGGVAADFALSSPNPAPFNSGAATTGTLIVTSLNAYANTLTVKNDTAPATGLKISCSPLTPDPIVAAGTSSLTCNYSSTIPGVYVDTFNVTDGTLFHLSPMIVRVGGFSMSGPLTAVRLLPGANVSSTVKLKSVNGFAGTVELTNTVTPSTGLSVSCPGSVSVNSDSSVPFACTFSSSVPNSYSVTIVGFHNFTGGSIVSSVLLAVNVGDFAVIVSSNPVTMPNGSTGTAPITLVPKFSWNKQVALAFGFSPSTGLAAVAGTSNPCNTPQVPNGVARNCKFASTASGIYTVTVNASCGPLQGCATTIIHPATFTISVNPDFTLSAISLSQAMIPIGSVPAWKITVTPQNSFTGTVSFSTSSNSGVNCVNPQQITITASSGTSSLLCGVSTAGNYTIRVTGTSAALSHSISITLRAVDFGMTASPNSLQLAVGQSALCTLTLSGLNGFTGTISLSTSVPFEASATITAGNVGLVPTLRSATLIMNITLLRQPTTTTLTLTIVGTSGTLTRTVTVTITAVQPAATTNQPESLPVLPALGSFELPFLVGVVALGAILIITSLRRRRNRVETSIKSRSPM